ncbi:OLC1v1026124C1 [Oldenlandia corymbosa var. corymbosa]|uniref:OLC1v1026124C1 n=1 Tax=Oldenlandia corymbosa var. corymbosa TaxID=529605 RepID=A0AAV1C8D9_OLDCO|nr:OLC1v1026124C1 [Oldenlandia corymbosa var. corymbosa]
MDSGPSNSDPKPRKKRRIDCHDEQFPSSAPPNEEAKSLLIPNFPDELLVEILSRLPARSLGKFKCVSKSWLSLFSTPQFIKAHLAIASGLDDYSHRSLIFTVLPPNTSAHLKRCSAAISTGILEVTDIDYPMKSPDKSFWTVGACNGLVCVTVDEKYLFLWNPCTKKFKNLPDIDVELKHGFYMMYGFGYDELHDDYKVVRIFCSFVGVAFETEVNLYSLKNNSWSRIGDFKGGIPLMDSAHYVNGNLHWAASTGLVWNIVSLDLAKLTYGEMERPSFEDCLDYWAIGVLGGCLSVLYEFAQKGVDVWVMKVYGDKDSWTKIVTVPYLDYPDKLGCSWPVCLLKNGEILLVIHSVLVLYCPKSKKFRWYPQINGLEEVSMFVESLISPDLHDGEQSTLRLLG